MAFDLDQEVIKHVDWRVLILKKTITGNTKVVSMGAFSMSAAA